MAKKTEPEEQELEQAQTPIPPENTLQDPGTTLGVRDVAPHITDQGTSLDS